MSVLSSPIQGPALVFSPELLLHAQGIKVAFFDVDGVLTDGGLYFSEYPHGHERAETLGGFRASGEIIKRFNTLDGHGLKLLQKVGITPVVITGRDSSVLRWALRIHTLAPRINVLRQNSRCTLWVWTGMLRPRWAMTGRICPS